VRHIVGLLLKVLLLPVRLVWHVLAGSLRALFGPLAGRIDSSGRLSSLINSLSSSMATQRGLLLMIGTGLLVLSLLAHAIVLALMVSTDSFERNLYWLCIPFTLLHVGVLAGFTGAMLATPLGQSYKDK
jgi:hypothetical protein